METRVPPGLYLEPPSFDIDLDDFTLLPRRRVEAIRLLREGQATEISNGSLAQQALTADARLLLLHGHGDRPSEAQHHRADMASHFILKLACCGGRADDGENEAGGGEGGGGGGVGEAGGGTGGGRGGGGEHPDRRWERREWFVRAETDLFEARLHWHLRGGADRAGRNGQELSVKPEARPASLNDRLHALRIVYNLGWLQPVADGLDDASAEATGPRYSADRRSTDRESAGRGSTDRESAEREIADREIADRKIADRKIADRGKGKRPRRNSSPSAEEGVPPSRLQKSSAHEGRPSVPPPPPPWVPRHPAPQASSGSTVSYVSCPFEKVLPLVRSRRVLLRGGKALLAPRQVPAAVVQHFKEVLREGMAVAERGLPGVERDERVKGVLVQVRRDIDRMLGGRRQGGGDDPRASVAITRQTIDQVAEKHFPLCMRRMLQVLRREHHLKYEARVQLVSFLGNAGMEVHELLGLWREEFPRGMSPEEYARKRNQYEYSLRHLYGLEGRRKAYRPRSCAQIASLGGGGGSGAGGYGHGCPFHAHSQRQTRGSCHSNGGGGDRGREGAGTSKSKSTIRGGGASSSSSNISSSSSSGGGSGSGRRGDGSSLRGMLEAQNLSAVDIEDIVGPLQGGGSEGGGGGCSGGKAVGACRRHYLATHRGNPGNGVWGLGGGGGGGGGGGEATPNGWLAASSRPQQPRSQQPQAFLTQEGD